MSKCSILKNLIQTSANIFSKGPNDKHFGLSQSNIFSVTSSSFGFFRWVNPFFFFLHKVVFLKDSSLPFSLWVFHFGILRYLKVQSLNWKGVIGFLEILLEASLSYSELFVKLIVMSMLLTLSHILFLGFCISSLTWSYFLTAETEIKVALFSKVANRGSFEVHTYSVQELNSSICRSFLSSRILFYPMFLIFTHHLPSLHQECLWDPSNL